MSPYKSKVDRLNVECADPHLLQNCIAGQKWHCVNENGRWRKHKCKFHAQLQSHLDAVSQFTAQNKRNCACFTPDGVIYTKIISDSSRRANSVLRHKRSVTEFDKFIKDMKSLKQLNGNLDSELKEHSDYMELYPHLYKIDQSINNERKKLRLKRSKRDINHISSFIDDLQKTLDSVESKFSDKTLELERQYENGTDRLTHSPVAKCYVRSDGKVNCSNIIYEDEKAWRQSRQQIDAIINLLKTKLNDLKDIKKHLKENRPAGIKDDEIENTSSTSHEDYVSKETKEPMTEQNPIRHNDHNGNRKSHHIHEQHVKVNNNRRGGKHNKFNKRRPNEEDEDQEEGPLIDMSLYVTEHTERSSTIVPIRHKNHLNRTRHNHTHKHTSTTPSSPEITSYDDQEVNSLSTSSPNNNKKHQTTTTQRYEIHSTKGMEDDDNNDDEENIDENEDDEEEDTPTTLSPISTEATQMVFNNKFNQDSVGFPPIRQRHSKHHSHRLSNGNTFAHNTNNSETYGEPISGVGGFHQRHGYHAQKKINVEAAECYCEPEVAR